MWGKEKTWRWVAEQGGRLKTCQTNHWKTDGAEDISEGPERKTQHTTAWGQDRDETDYQKVGEINPWQRQNSA